MDSNGVLVVGNAHHTLTGPEVAPLLETDPLAAV
jgi:hypothetical protein